MAAHRVPPTPPHAHPTPSTSTSTTSTTSTTSRLHHLHHLHLHPRCVRAPASLTTGHAITGGFISWNRARPTGLSTLSPLPPPPAPHPAPPSPLAVPRNSRLPNQVRGFAVMELIKGEGDLGVRASRLPRSRNGRASWHRTRRAARGRPRRGARALPPAPEPGAPWPARPHAWPAPIAHGGLQHARMHTCTSPRASPRLTPRLAPRVTPRLTPRLTRHPGPRRRAT